MDHNKRYCTACIMEIRGVKSRRRLPHTCDQAACGKVKYATQEIAADYAASMSVAFGRQYPYFCVECDCWHLTSVKPKKKEGG